MSMIQLVISNLKNLSVSTGCITINTFKRLLAMWIRVFRCDGEETQ